MPIRVRPVSQCPVCESQETAIVYNSLTDRAYRVSGEWRIVRCLRCGAGRLNPVPIPDDLEQCYVAAYYTHETPRAPSVGSSRLIAQMRGAVLGVHRGYSHLQPQGAGLLGWLLKYLPSVWKRASFNLGEMLPFYKNKGKLLEIGCGNGENLALMRLLMWDVFGIELDPIAAAQASVAAKCEIHTGTIENAPFQPESFDVITSSHVIEHVYDPKSFVTAAAGLLKKGGVFLVQTPNFESLGHKLFGSNWFSLDPPRHLCLFTPRSLRQLLMDSGQFASVRTTTESTGSSLVLRRRHAALKTGNFLADVDRGLSESLKENLFCGLEHTGNRLLHWGEQLQCAAVKG